MLLEYNKEVKTFLEKQKLVRLPVPACPEGKGGTCSL